MSQELEPRNRPCAACPYRQDCPSGIWHESEYVKLQEYDNDTSQQPFGVFMCHDARDNKTMCRGWLDTHDKVNLLSLRLASLRGMVDGSVFELPPSDIPVFESGKAAALHGMQEIDQPGQKAATAIRHIQKKRKMKRGRKRR